MTNPIIGTNDGDYLVDTADDDSIEGLGGNDTVSSYNGGSDTVLGGAGDDVLGGIGKLDGGIGNDSLSTYSGLASASTLLGGDGNDTITNYSWFWGAHFDVLDGGNGDDYIEGAGTVSGGAGNDFLIAHGGLFSGGAGNDGILIFDTSNVDGGTGNDTISSYTLYGTSTIHGGKGDDAIFLYSSHDVVDGGLGNDTITIGQGSGGTISGGAGDDSLVFSGAEADYHFYHSARGLIIDNGGGAVLESAIETLVFNDGSMATPSTAGLGNYVLGTTENATLTGTGLDDWLVGYYGVTSLSGGAGNDRIDGNGHLNGDAGNDTISGSGTLSGGADNDYLTGYGTLDGGLGDDSIIIHTSNWQPSSVTGGDGNDTIDGIYGSGGDYISAGDGNDLIHIAASTGYDTVDGGTGDDTITTSGLESTLWPSAQLNGGDGNDVIVGEGTLDGGIGDDTLTGTQGSVLHGGDGTDTAIFAGSRADYTVLLDADNQLIVHEKDWYYNDTLTGIEVLTFDDGSYNMADQPYGRYVYGTDKSEHITGTAHEDYIDAGSGKDNVNGGDGNDTIFGDNGNDTLSGGDGNDQIQGGLGNDSLVGGDGNDTLYGNSDIGYGAGQHDTLIGGAGDDMIRGNGAGDLIYGGDGNDMIGGGGSIDGGAGDDNIYVAGPMAGTVPTLMGGDGNDTIGVYGDLISIAAYGGAGDDFLRGSGIADTLVGGAGNDTLQGWGGGDHYVLGAAGLANGVDSIPIFYGGGYAGSDELDFTGADYGFAAGHQLTAAEFTAGSAAVGANAQFVWDQSTATLYWDHDGAGGDAAVALAVFGGWVQVTAADLHFL